MKNRLKRIIVTITTISLLFGLLPIGSVSAAEDIAELIFNSEDYQRVNMDIPIQSSPVIKIQNNEEGWVLSPGTNIGIDIEDTFMYQLNGMDTPIVEVRYLDEGYGGFCIYYDSRTGNKGKFVQLENSNLWKTVTFNLYDAYFANRTRSYDLWIDTNNDEIMGKSPADVTIASVRVRRSGKSAPFEISARSENTGNIFYEGNEVKFNILYEGIGILPSTYFKTSYIVKEYGGEVVLRKDINLSANPSASDVITINDLPYGVYELYISVTGPNISQSYVTDFAYAKSADTNMHYGINAHFDDEIYTKDEIKGIVDLAKAAGFGFVRSSLRWNQIETGETKEKYVIPENVKYAEKYLEDNGMEMLGIVYSENNLHNTSTDTKWGYWLPVEADRNAFRDYCEFVARDLKADENDIDYFCMLNEFNYRNGAYQENEQEYVDIAKAGYEGLTAGNPKAFINGGAFAGKGAGLNGNYAKKTYDLGVLDYCDSYSMHPYAHGSSPEVSWLSDFSGFKNNLKTADPTILPWVTETGWPTRASVSKSDEEVNMAVADSIKTEAGEVNSCSELEQAKWYARSMALNGDDEQIDKLFYYTLNDNNINYYNIQSNFGIVYSKMHRTPFAAKPAYVAACASNDIIGGAEYTENVLKKIYSTYENASYGTKYIRNDGSEVICLWNAEGDASPDSYTFTTTKPHIVVYDMYGNIKEVKQNTSSYRYTCKTEPVYIMGADTVPAVAEPILTSENGEAGVASVIMNFSQGSKRIVSGWFLEENEGITASFPSVGQAGNNITAVCAAYKNDMLIDVKIKSVTVTDGDMDVSYDFGKSIEADEIKIMILDDMNRVVPLRSTGVLSYYDKDASVNAEFKDGVCKVSGFEKNMSPNKEILLTALTNTARRSELTGDTLSDKVLYMRQTKTSGDGSYNFEFPIPAEYQGDEIVLMVSTENSTVQCLVPRNK